MLEPPEYFVRSAMRACDASRCAELGPAAAAKPPAKGKAAPPRAAAKPAAAAADAKPPPRFSMSLGEPRPSHLPPLPPRPRGHTEGWGTVGSDGVAPGGEHGDRGEGAYAAPLEGLEAAVAAV